MANVVVNKFKFESMKGDIDLSADNEIKVALIKNRSEERRGRERV
jgi:hypothetical protein